MALSKEKISQLRNELLSDPLGLGYAQHIEAGRHGDIEAILADASGRGVGPVTLARVPRDVVLLGLAPAMLALDGKESGVKERWDRILGTIRSAESLTINAETLAIFGLAIVDGILTLPQAEAIYKRPGTRGEVLFGAGAHADTDDIAKALRG